MKKSAKKLRFGLTADSHYADRQPYRNRFYRDSVVKMREFIQTMEKEKVDFIMHLGDFKDEDEKKLEKDTLKYLEVIESEYAKFRGPRFHCIGNHDVDSITKVQFLNGIENTSIPKKDSYYSFDFNEIHCIVLDANYSEDGVDHFYKNPINFRNTNIPEKEISWLKNDLLIHQDKPTLVFCHHPIFEYYRDGKQYHVNNFLEIQSLLEQHGNVLLVLQGHVHQEKFVQINGIHYITQLAMVDYPGIENNSFALIEIGSGYIKIIGFKRSSSQILNTLI